MNLLETFTHGVVAVPIYQEQRKELYATIDDLKTALGYKARRGIEKLIERNPHLLENEYSIVSSVPYAVYGQDKRNRGQRKAYETRLFTRLGIYEVVSLCTTKHARAIRKALFEYIKRLEQTLKLATIKHLKSVGTQCALHDAIADSPAYCEYSQERISKVFMNFNKLLNKTASKGRTSKKEELMPGEIDLLKRLERKTAVWLDEGHDYHSIKSLLGAYCECKSINTLENKESPLLGDRAQEKYVYECKDGRLFYAEH